MDKDIAQLGHRYLRDTVDLRQPQPTAGDDLPGRRESDLYV